MTHIDKTIIDGSQPSNPDSGSVVYFIDGEDTTSVLCGLTIRGGSGTILSYEGISYRYGGGVLLESASGRLSMNNISHNRLIAASAFGGGVSALCVTENTPYLILEENRISDNFVQSVSAIGDNYGSSGGADLTGVSARIIGNVFERDTVMAANIADCGALGLFLNPTSGFLPAAYIKDNIFRNNFITAKNDVLGAGMFVYGTAEVTIKENHFEYNLATSTSGYANGGGLYISDEDITGYGRKMILKNRFINNRTQVVSGNNSNGGGIHLHKTQATVAENEITQNRTYGSNGFGGGICIDWTSFRLENNIIYGNSSSLYGGGLDIYQPPQQGTEQLLVNNTIYYNQAKFGGGVGIRTGANVVAMNNIFWADTANTGREIYVSSATGTIRYCNVQGGYAGTGNINTDPMFIDDAFHLSDSSPCLNTGIDSLQIGGIWYYAPTNDFGGNDRPQPAGTRPDMGAWESDFINSLEENHDASLLKVFALKQNYPNPFNPVTTINYELPITNYVDLSIYNLLGQKVATLVSKQQTAGRYTAQWDATGFASGVYYYEIKVGNFRDVRKMILLR